MHGEEDFFRNYFEGVDYSQDESKSNVVNLVGILSDWLEASRLYVDP